jgi:glutathione S-transferase
MIIYGDRQSGNCYKLQLLASLLDIPHRWVDIDILEGETGSREFLDKNPVGQIPLLELDDGRILSESNAILNFLAEGSVYLPGPGFERAKVLQWQFFEQYSHEPYIAVARFISKYLGLPEDRRAEFEARQEGGHRALKIMERQLERTPWLTGGLPTIADISLYAYTHVADEGGFDLEGYPAIRSWIDRVRSLPGYSGMAEG